MREFNIVNCVIRASLDYLGFGEFYVLIIPDDKGKLNYYLMHDTSSIVVHMFGISRTETMEEAAEIAHNNAPQYIAQFIEQHFS